MGLPEPVHQLTEAEYLEIERRAEFKSEFFDGEMFAMAGGTFEHSRIATNLATALQNRLAAGPCQPFNSDLRIKIEATGLLTYPDVSVICGPPRFFGNERDTVVNPTVLVEVLSDSTEAYDRGTKFLHCQQIPTLREYLLVSQKEPRVEQFIRQEDDEWRWRKAVGLEATLELPSLHVTVALSEIFAHVEFAPSAIHPRLASPG
jgi:Uma2 family endonuclease